MYTHTRLQLESKKAASENNKIFIYTEIYTQYIENVGADISRKRGLNF